MTQLLGPAAVPVPREAWSATVLHRAPGVRLLGRYEGGGYVDDRFLAVRRDGQPALLTRLPYLVLQHAVAGRTVEQVADVVSEAYGRRLTVDLLCRLVEDRLVPAGLVVPPGVRPATAATRPVRLLPSTGAGAAPTRPDGAHRPLLSITLKRPLLPARLVRVTADRLSFLFHPPLVALVLAAFVVADVWLFAAGGIARIGVISTPGELLAVLALILGATLLHEFGHAAGCRYGGGRPGAIGAAMYLWFPVMWTEVTDAYRLDRRSRLRTDLGGVYFNALFIAAAVGLFAWTGWAPLAIAALLVNVIALQQFLPVIRMDGYYILGDLTGVPNLFALMGPSLRSMVTRRRDKRVAALRPGTRRVVMVWSVVSFVALTGSLVWLVVSFPDLVTSTWHQARLIGVQAVHPPSLLAGIAGWVCLVALLLPFVGAAALLLRAALWTIRRRPATTSGGSGASGVSGVSGAAVAPATALAPVDEPALDAGDFTESAMLRRRRTPPRSGWRRTVFLATGGVVHPGPSPAERREAQLVERVRARLTVPRRIVVLSRKGGAGKTTTTLMLGHTLATHRGDRVVALDANPDAGSLPYRVERETSATVTSLLAEAHRLTSYAAVRAHTSQAPSRLEVVASDDDPRITRAFGQVDVSRAVDVLAQHYMLLLMDSGTGILDDATQGLLREADQVVLVMPPALDGARVAASTLDWLDRNGFHDLVATSVAVVNGVRSENTLVHLDAVEDHFRARCAGVVRIPWDRALEAGARTALDDLRPATRDAYLELAATVAEQFEVPSLRGRR